MLGLSFVLSMDGTDNDPECKHGQPQSWCSFCSPRSDDGRTVSRRQGRASLNRPMHVLLKWNPEKEIDTLDRHRQVADLKGVTWWGCDSTSSSKRTARSRIDHLNDQIRRGETVWAFVYRTGDAPRSANVWRADVGEVTDNPEAVDEGSRPSGYPLDGSFLWLKLSNFVPLERGWVLNNLELFDQQRALDRGALANQQSPMFVSLRTSTAMTI